MNLLKLANIIEKKSTTLVIEPNLCTRMISPKSSCRSCVEYCPANCISFKKNMIEISDNCLECGLCTTVCPTGAISSQRPSLNQLMEEIKDKCKENEQVYLRCHQHAITNHQAATVSVPCFGVIPREAWLTIIQEYDNFAINHPGGNCQQCEFLKGEEVWRKELSAGEQISGKRMEITATVLSSNEHDQLDTSKRSFFYSILREWKATNKLAVREILGNSEVQTYQEKMQQDSRTKVKKEWSEATNQIIEKVIHESAHSYQNRRNLFLKQLINNRAIQQQKDVRLPIILPDCTFCGACALLCPTNALKQETENGVTKIFLSASDCVDCRLCEDICYFKQISMVDTLNIELLSDVKVLISCSEK